jgi:hypothetical protein
MTQSLFSRQAACLSVACVLLVAGCATKTPPLYYWGDYQKEVYGHFTKDVGPEEQIAALESGIEKARASGLPVPPGYNAHLGVLYAQTEHADKMLHYFTTEKALYPESAAYMDFLMRKYQQPHDGRVR